MYWRSANCSGSAANSAAAALIERVGMDGQRLIENLDELEQPSGYFSIILVKEQSE